jgi:hypothetical protein
MPNIITIHDSDFNIVSANEEAKNILKLPPLDISDAKCYEYYHGKDWSSPTFVDTHLLPLPANSYCWGLT